MDRTAFLKGKGVGDDRAENVAFLRLLDAYGALLTERQRQVADLFFNCDLSLAEIAAETGVSRQSVSECIGTAKARLRDYEARLGHVRAMEEAASALAAHRERVARLAAEVRAEAPQLARRLEDLNSD